MSRWFVMLYHPAGYPTPVIDEDAFVGTLEVKPALYDSEDAADRAMLGHAAAVAWGWGAYEWPA